MIAPWKNEKVRLAYERPEIKASVEIILSVFTVAGLLFLAIRPTLATIATLQKKIEDQKIVDQKLETKITQLVRAQTDLSTYRDRLQDYTDAVPELHGEGSLAKRIELLAQETGLTINNLSFGAVPMFGRLINLSDKSKGMETPETMAEGKIAIFDISFDLSGNPNQISDYLTRLENMDRVVILSGVNLQKEDLKTTIQSENSVESQVVRGVRVVGTANAYYVLENQE